MIAATAPPTQDHAANGKSTALVFVYNPADPARDGAELPDGDVPAALADALRAGRAVAAVPCDALVPFSFVADFLNEPYRQVEQLTADGTLPVTNPTWPRVRFAAVLAYQARRRAQRQRAREERLAVEREMGMTD